MGFCNLSGTFILNFAGINAPLTSWFQKEQADVLVQLNDEERNAPWTLQDRLISPPILALPRSEGHYTPDTDTYDQQIGGVLLQKQNENVGSPTPYVQ